MRYRIGHIILVIMVSITAVLVGTQANNSLVFAVSDELKTEVCQGANAEGSTSKGCDQAGSAQSLNKTLALVINMLSFIGGVIAVIMIIVAGFKFMTAQGDSGSIASARNTLLYAIVGLVIIAMAQVIVQFVIKKV